MNASQKYYVVLTFPLKMTTNYQPKQFQTFTEAEAAAVEYAGKYPMRYYVLEVQARCERAEQPVSTTLLR